MEFNMFKPLFFTSLFILAAGCGGSVGESTQGAPWFDLSAKAGSVEEVKAKDYQIALKEKPIVAKEVFAEKEKPIVAKEVFAEVVNTAMDSEPWLNLRVAPENGTQVVAEMFDGTKLLVLEKREWWKVRVISGWNEGSVGWAYPKYMRDLNENQLNPPVRTPTPAADLKKRIDRDPSLIRFHGVITEPFMDIYITPDELLIEDIGAKYMESFSLINSFNRHKRGQTVLFVDRNGQMEIVLIKKEAGSDGMSGRRYSYSMRFKRYLGAGESGQIIH
jgi:uncharacterized membrane protein